MQCGVVLVLFVVCLLFVVINEMHCGGGGLKWVPLSAKPAVPLALQVVVEGPPGGVDYCV
jgi:hypothetical protein